MSTEHLLEKVITTYGEAWNSPNAGALLAMHTEDSAFEIHASGGKGFGKYAIREILKGFFAAFPDVRFDARRTYARDGFVRQKCTATGTLAIPYTRGSSTVPPTG